VRAEHDLPSEIESILLVAGGPVALASLAKAVEARHAQVSAGLGEIQKSLRGGIRLQIHDGQAQLVTASENADVVHRFLGTAKPQSLSRAALETLTIIAYRQPVTRSELEATRGVNSDRALQTLMARGLIEEHGRRQSLGRPAEYGTTFGFLEYFGLSVIDDLPSLPKEDRKEMEASKLGLRVVPLELDLVQE
jgi:segregation and condensation protein B